MILLVIISVDRQHSALRQTSKHRLIMTKRYFSNWLEHNQKALPANSGTLQSDGFTLLD